eukprot:2814011-Rhodomonas_salina.1
MARRVVSACGTVLSTVMARLPICALVEVCWHWGVFELCRWWHLVIETLGTTPFISRTPSPQTHGRV